MTVLGAAWIHCRPVDRPTRHRFDPPDGRIDLLSVLPRGLGTVDRNPAAETRPQGPRDAQGRARERTGTHFSATRLAHEVA